MGSYCLLCLESNLDSSCNAAATADCVPSTVEEPNASGGAAVEGSHKDNVRECMVRMGKLDFRPGLEMRRFVAVPEGSTWGEMRIRAGPHDTPK